jgi:hypothetical protein
MGEAYEILARDMKEVFLPVARDTVYEVSNLGRIRNARNVRHRKPDDHEGGYYRISLRGNKTWYLHVLVAEAHLPKPEDPARKLVDHIDGNKHNNRVDNLRWATAKENTAAHYKLSKKSLTVTMFDKCGKVVAKYESAQSCIAAQKELPLSTLIISRICRGTRAPFRGYTFQYEKPLRQRHVPTLREDEDWREVSTFEGKDFAKYQISSYGQLRNKRGFFQKPFVTGGYVAYKLSNEGVQMEVRAHRLVAHAYCRGRTETKNIVHHKDENRQNNHHTNLEWCTSRENSQFSLAKRVDQLTLDGICIATHVSITLATEAVGKRATGSICCACSGKHKTAYGFKWRYSEV